MNDVQVYFDLATLAMRLSLSKRTIRNYIRDPADPLPAYRVGGKLLFKWSKVEQWLERWRVRPVDVDRIVSEFCSEVLEK